MSGSERADGLRVRVDGATCIGSSTCVGLAPEAFALDDDGVARVVDASALDEARLRAVERSCPTGAIFVESPPTGSDRP